MRGEPAGVGVDSGSIIYYELYDAAVSGTDPIAERPWFKAMLERIAADVSEASARRSGAVFGLYDAARKRDA